MNAPSINATCAGYLFHLPDLRPPATEYRKIAAAMTIGETDRPVVVVERVALCGDCARAIDGDGGATRGVPMTRTRGRRGGDSMKRDAASLNECHAAPRVYSAHRLPKGTLRLITDGFEVDVWAFCQAVGHRVWKWTVLDTTTRCYVAGGAEDSEQDACTAAMAAIAEAEVIR